MIFDELRYQFFQQLRSALVQLDGSHPGRENMRRDVLLTERLSDSDDSRMLIRFYSWQPWCISLGANQPEEDVDQARADADGIELVRRPTGGRAILHARELTYALALRLRDGLTQAHVYRFWHEWLCSVLARVLGAPDLVYARTQPDFPFLLHREPTRWLCFASSARYELLWRGRKVLGSAQRLYGDILLQHGSLLLDEGHERLPYYLRDCPNPESLSEYLRQRSATCAEIAGRHFSAEELASRLTDEIRCAELIAPQ